MRRPAVITAIAFGVVVFLTISLLLARGLSGAGVERAQTLEVLEAQARGDAEGVLRRLGACRAVPACVTVTRERVGRLKRPGDVEILSFEPSTRLTVTRQTGTARVAWRAGTGPPVVQCVRVRRDGPLAGGKVELLAVSAPIDAQGICA
jgi:hypothetical protein